MGALLGKAGVVVVRYLPLMNSFFPRGVLTSVPILMKIDVTVGVLADRLTNANRFYNLSHAICYSYGIDNEVHSGLLEVFFSSRVVTRWNMLDQQIVVATILNAFKNE